MSVSRQFTLLVAAFAIAMPASVGGLAYVMYSSLAAVHQVNAEGTAKPACYLR
jgi:type II secretory pathway component PulJ